MMTRTSKIKRLATGAAGLALLAGCGVASGHTTEPDTTTTQSASSPEGTGQATGSAAGEPSGSDGHHGDGATPSETATTPAPAPARPGTIKVVRGTPVDNIRQDAAPPETSAFCDESDLPPGEGAADKGNTCVSTPLGEVADHPVRVAANTRFFQRTDKPVKVNILVADNQGVLDLNAFTFDQTGGAGVTLHERPAELDENGRPLLHCHLGVTTLSGFGALPGEDYDAAFSGIQGFKGDLTAEITGLPRGTYRGDVYCSAPGHPMLPTSKATEVQAFDTFDFKVIGRK